MITRIFCVIGLHKWRLVRTVFDDDYHGVDEYYYECRRCGKEMINYE